MFGLILTTFCGRLIIERQGNSLQFWSSAEVVLESLDARALRKFGRPDLIPAGFRRPASFVYRAAIHVRVLFLNGSGTFCRPKPGRKITKTGKFFKDKIVLIGPIAEIFFHDIHDTPSPIPDAKCRDRKLHLNIINAALHKEFLESILSDGAIACHHHGRNYRALVVCFLVRQPLKRFALVILLTAVYWWLPILFSTDPAQPSTTTPVLVPAVVLISSSLVAMTYDYLLERVEKRRVRRTLERYVSRDIVKELLDNPETFFNVRGGVRRRVTVLFCDVRGFTTMTESSDESKLVQQLNEYFEMWLKLFSNMKGSLDKFIGDAVMAVWGNIPGVSRGEHKDAQNSVATALKIRPRLIALNETWKARGRPEFGISVWASITGMRLSGKSVPRRRPKSPSLVMR